MKSILLILAKSLSFLSKRIIKDAIVIIRKAWLFRRMEIKSRAGLFRE